MSHNVWYVIFSMVVTGEKKLLQIMINVVREMKGGCCNLNSS